MPSNLPRLTVRLPQETIDKLKEIAEAEHRSTNEQIHHILDNYIKNYEAQHSRVGQKTGKIIYLKDWLKKLMKKRSSTRCSAGRRIP